MDGCDIVAGFTTIKLSTNTLGEKVRTAPVRARAENAKNALEAMHKGDVNSACSLLGAFINEVNAQAGSALTTDQANQLISLTNQIKAALGCP